MSGPGPPPSEGSRRDPSRPGGSGPAATWSPYETLPVFVLAVVAAAALSAPLAAFLTRSALFDVGTLLGELAFAAAVVLWVRYVNHAPLEALGMPTRPWVDLAVGVGAGIALLILGDAVLLATRELGTRLLGHRPVDPDQVAPYVRGITLYLLGPVVVLAAPLGEELLFRGFLYRSLRRRLSVWPAAIVSGLAFGLLHYGGLGFLLLIPALFVVGIGLALVYERRQSLLASMVAHATFNLVGFLSILLSRR